MSTLVLDTITGKSTATTVTIGSTPVVSASANSMTIRGEGSAQTSIQQGLAKCWEQSVGAGTSFLDSFNAASLTDVGTGSAQVNYTSNMANDDCSLTMGHQFTDTNGTGAFFTNAANRSTSSHRKNHFENAAATDPLFYNSTIHGDLA